MKKEHFKHVTEHFNLSQYDWINKAYWWSEDREGLVITSNIRAQFNLPESYIIKDIKTGVHLFKSIPSQELAEEIIQYIKDTEILFI